MAEKILVDFGVELDSYKQGIAEISAINKNLTESAKKAGDEISKAFADSSDAKKYSAAFEQARKVINEFPKDITKVNKAIDDLINRPKPSGGGLEGQVTGILAELKKLEAASKNATKTFAGVSKNVKVLEDRLRDLSIQGKQGTDEFNKIAKEIGEFKAAITVADRAVDLYAKSTDAATGRVGELEDKLFDLAIAGKQNTKEFEETRKEVVRLKQAIFEVDQQVDSYVERSRGLTSVVQSVELIANGFQVVEGATALFGVESEQLQETLVRLNAIIAITSGLEQARTILLEQSAKKTGILAAVQKAYTFVVGTSTGALRAFKIALFATGVGAIIGVIGLLVEAFTSLNDEVEDTNDNYKRLAELGAEANQSLIDSARRLLVAQGKLAQSEIDIDAVKFEKKKQLEVAFETFKKELSELGLKRQKAAAKSEQDIANVVNENAVQRREEIRKLEEEAKGQQRAFDNENLKITESFISTRKDIIASGENEINIIRANSQKESTKVAKKELEEQIFDLRKFLDDYRAIVNARVEADAELIDSATFDANIAAIETALADVENKLNTFNESAANLGQEELAQARDLIAQEAKLRSDAAEIRANEEIRLLQNQSNAEIERIKETTKNLNAITALEQKTANEILLIQAKLRLDQGEIDQKYYDKLKELIKESTGVAVSSSEEETDESEKSDKEKGENKKKNAKEQIDTAFKTGSQVASILFDIGSSFRQREIQDIEAARDFELENQNLTARQREEIEKKAQKKIAAIRRQEAVAAKSEAIFSIFINTAANVVKNFKLAPVLIALGAVQAAAVAARPIPKFKMGGWIKGKSHESGGELIEAENKEFIMRSSSAQRYPKELEKMNRSPREFEEYIFRSRVRPALLADRMKRAPSEKVVVNANVNTSIIEKELRKTRDSYQRNTVEIINALQTNRKRREWNG
jgi:hypothetical protein